MDVFAPCNFANIQGYPHDLPEMDKLPIFQGNDAVSVKSHLFAFTNWWNRFAVTKNNFDDVKMKTFVLTFGEDVAEWFTEKPDSSFNTFESIVTAFKEKYGDKREDRHLVIEISTIKKKENETTEEFNRRFNGILREISQTHKPPDGSLLNFYIDAFDSDTSYELRRAKTANYKACQSLAEEIEKDKKASGMSKTLDFEEDDDDPMKNLMQKLESMELNQAKLISEHAKEISVLQARLVQMERAQMQNSQLRNNNALQKRDLSYEQRPTNPLESTNLVDEVPPYCRVCDALHEEATCPIVKRIIASRMVGSSHQINVVGKNYHRHIEDHESQVKEPAQMIRDVQPNLMQIIQNMEANQINLQNKITSMEASHAQEIKIMESNHSNQIIAMEEKHVKAMTIMEENHKKEMNCMQKLFVTMKANNDESIKNMEHRLLMIEESHAKEMTVVNIKHSNQMTDMQKKLEKMENLHIQKFQPKFDYEDSSIDHETSCLLKPFPSHHTEDLTMVSKDVEKDQAYVSPLTGYIQNNIGHTPGSSDILYKHLQDEDKEFTVVSLLTSQPTQKKRKKQKRSKWFDSSDGREQLDIRIKQSPTLCKIGHGTSEKQPTDLPESRQMLSIHYIEHI